MCTTVPCRVEPGGACSGREFSGPDGAGSDPDSMAGYSHRPLAAKLGIRPDTAIAILGAPATYDRVLGLLPKTVRREDSRDGSRSDLVHVFVTSRRAFERRIASSSNAPSFQPAPSGSLGPNAPRASRQI